MQRSGLSRIIARLSFLALVILILPITALVVFYSPLLEGWRRAKAEQLLSDAIDLKTNVNGPVTIGFGLEPTISVYDLSGAEDDLPNDMKGVSAKSLRLRISLLKLLSGSVDLSSLVVEGLKVDIDIPLESAALINDVNNDMDVTGFVQDFVRSPFAADITFHDAQLNYVNEVSGFTISYAFDSLSAKAGEGDTVVATGVGRINGEPWKAAGKVDAPGDDPDKRSFSFTGVQAGLTSSLAGTYTLADEHDQIDAVFTGDAPELVKLLDVYGVKSDFEGNGKVSARFSGPLNAPKMTELALKLAFDNGNTVEMSGGIADVMQGTGLALALSGTLPPKAPKEGEAKPIYDLGVTGFSGRIEGAIDEVLVRDLHIVTSAVKAQLRDIGPITAERLYKNAQGQLGLYDLLVLACDPKNPCVRVAGTIKDVLEFQGVELKGNINFLTADFLDLAAEDKAPLLGHIKGDIAVSDADGSLGIEAFNASVTDSTLLKLSIDLVFDDLEHEDEIQFDTHLDIPKFKAFAGGAQKLSATGTAVVGETTIVGTVTGSFAQAGPLLTGDLATQLLHLHDVVKLQAINAVYDANIDTSDVDVFDYSDVWKTLFVDLQVKVAKIAGGGDGASNIQGRLTYQAGVLGLDPITMIFLGGKASASGKIDTNGEQNTFALKGGVSNMRIGALLRELKSSYPVSGALQVSYDLSGAGDSIAQVPRSLDGSLSLSLRNGWLGTSLLDLAGLSLPNWLLTRTPGGNQANLVCMVAPFSFAQGKGTTRGFVMETDDVQVVGVGFIDFRAKEVNLRFKPKALRQQFIKIAQPFAVQGPLSHPQLRLTGAPVAGAVVEVLAFPFNLLDTIVQPGPRDKGRAPCRVIQTSRTAGGLLNLPIGGRQGPLLSGPLLGRSSPLRAPLGILKQPLLGGPSR
jgi:AsmA family protein